MTPTATSAVLVLKTAGGDLRPASGFPWMKPEAVEALVLHWLRVDACRAA
jgi:hypothetical protein